jgi:hypothetical protein
MARSCILAPTLELQVLSLPTMFNNPLPKVDGLESCEWEKWVHKKIKKDPVRANFLIFITVLVFVAAKNSTQC